MGLARAPNPALAKHQFWFGGESGGGAGLKGQGFSSSCYQVFGMSEYKLMRLIRGDYQTFITLSTSKTKHSIWRHELYFYSNNL